MGGVPACIRGLGLEGFKVPSNPDHSLILLQALSTALPFLPPIFGDSSLHNLIFLHLLAKYEDLYAFSYNPKQNESEQAKGWQLIDLAEEYKRMGVPNDYWQLSDANRDYKVRVVVEKIFCCLFFCFILWLWSNRRHSNSMNSLGLQYKQGTSRWKEFIP